MNQEQQSNAAGTDPAAGCHPRDVASQIADALGIGPETRQHLRNARIEMLKAVRSAIDARIEHLSRTEQKGTKVTVD